MVKDYSDFIKPIRQIIRALIEADYKTIESQGWASAEHAERVVNGARSRHFSRLDRTGQRPEYPPKGCYWFIVLSDEEIKDNLKENAFLLYTRPYDEARFPKFPYEPGDDLEDDNDEFCCYLKDVIDGKAPLTDSSWHISIRLISQSGTKWGTLLLEAEIKDNSLLFNIVATDV